MVAELTQRQADAFYRQIDKALEIVSKPDNEPVRFYATGRAITAMKTAGKAKTSHVNRYLKEIGILK